MTIELETCQTLHVNVAKRATCRRDGRQSLGLGFRTGPPTCANAFRVRLTQHQAFAYEFELGSCPLRQALMVLSGVQILIVLFAPALVNPTIPVGRHM